MRLQNIFYVIKPVIPRRLQILLRQRIIHKQRPLYANIWPIDENAGQPSNGSFGWPDRKQFAVVLTHDVDTEKGQNECHNLIRLEKKLGFRSSFNFVPERYSVSDKLRYYLTINGFEVGVHGLYHDGKLYRSKEIFQRRASRINHYLKQWGSVGFRSPAMHHNLEWIHDLNILYDSSTFDTDPFEPQSDGVGTIFPFWVPGKEEENGYVELPYTLPQDFTIFVLMRERNIDIWKRKLDWVVDKGGMVLLNTHPDYMIFNRQKPGLEEYPVDFYTELLEYIKYKYEGQYWHPLPKQMAQFWLKKNSKRKLPVFREAVMPHPLGWG